MSPRFLLLSRPGCHLCEEMVGLLESVLPAYDESFAVEDVDSRPDWRLRFGDVIPVLLRDGRPVAKIRLDRERLQRIVEPTRVRRAEP